MRFRPARQVPSLKVLRDHLLMEGRIEEKVFIDLVSTVKEALSKEPNVLSLRVPITGMSEILDVLR